MKLYPVKEIDLRVRRPYTNNFKVLQEFVEGDYDIVEVRDFTNKNASSCASSLNSSARRYKFNVMVIRRGERVFLMRK